jgi:AcrR family transcriptional regulator
MADPSDPRSDADAPKARLLAAAVACIEEHGLPSVTTRQIAAKAGLNGAAVNYYFGSKEQLLDQALELTRREGFVHPLTDFDRLIQNGSSPLAALRSVLRQLLFDSLQYPKLSFAHLRAAIEHQEYDGPSVVQLNSFLRQLDQRLGEASSPERRRARRIRLGQIWSVLGLNAMAPGLLRSFTGLDLKREPDLDLFLDQLLAGFPAE